MKTKSFLIIVCFLLSSMLLIHSSCFSNSESERLLLEASKLFNDARDKEKTSYRQAYEMYEHSLSRLELIISDYRDSEQAIKLKDGTIRVGPYTFNQFKEVFLPQARLRADAEESPLACALYINQKLCDNSIIKDERIAEIADVYIEAGLYGKADELYGLISDASFREGTLSSMATGYAKSGKFYQALNVILEIKSASCKAQTLSNVSSEYMKAGHKDKALTILSEALDAAEAIADPAEKAKMLTDMAIHYNNYGDKDKSAVIFSQAVEIARSIPGPDALPLFRFWDPMDKTTCRSNTLMKMTLKYLITGRFDQVLKVAGTIDDKSYRANALSVISFAYLKNGCRDEADRILSQSLAIIQNIDDSDAKASLLGSIALKFQEIDQYGRVLEIAEIMPETQMKSLALAAVASYYTSSGRFNQSLHVAEMIDDLHLKDGLLRNIASRYADSGNYKRALEIAESISESDEKSHALSRIAASLAKQRNYEEASRIARLIEGDNNKCFALKLIAAAYAESGQYERALSTARVIPDRMQRDYALRGIAKCYADSSLFEKSIQMVDKIHNVDQKAFSLEEIGLKCIEKGFYERASQIALMIDGLKTETEFAGNGPLRNLGIKFAEAGQYANAIDIAVMIRRGDEKFDVLFETGSMLLRAGKKLDSTSEEMLHRIVRSFEQQ
ncbi:MAG: hypothetical protein RDV48_30655 [Candidatus Eremiobacteraeota bacterium]|nr:hypothetical protein [Candidatus Eremiobacteraeota bacterium]